MGGPRGPISTCQVERDRTRLLVRLRRKPGKASVSQAAGSANKHELHALVSSGVVPGSDRLRTDDTPVGTGIEASQSAAENLCLLCGEFLLIGRDPGP